MKKCLFNNFNISNIIILVIFLLLSSYSICYSSIPQSKSTSKRSIELTIYHRELGVKLETAGDFIGAEIQYLESLEYTCTDEYTLFDLGHLYLKINKPNKALEYLNTLVSLNPTDHESLNLLGVAYSGVGNKQEAIKCWKKSLIITPEQPKILEILKEFDSK